MQMVGGQGKGKKDQAVQIEWEFREDEAAWQNAWGPPALAPTPTRRWSYQWWLAGGLLLLLLSASATWLWHQAQRGLAQTGAELSAVVEAELWTAQQKPTAAGSLSTLAITTQAIAAAEPFVQVAGTRIANLEIVNLGDDWAVVELTLQQAERSYRQRYAYQRTQRGWQRTTPLATYWGAAHTLETDFFVIHYYANDGAAVTAAASQLETLMPALLASYLSAPAQASKWVIQISPQPPIGQSHQEVTGDAMIQIAAPALALLPAQISQGEWLATAVYLAVLKRLVEDAVARNIPSPLQHSQAEEQLGALLHSVQVWQAWRTDLPLAALRKPLVQWIYADVGYGERALPDLDPQLCDLQRLWLDAPPLLQAPLFCGAAQPGDPYQRWRYLYAAPWTLASPSIFTPATPADPQPAGDPAAVIGLATLVEYLAATYGPQRVATLIANTPLHSSWETLIAATVGVPLPEFEAGWENYLAQEYGIAPQLLSAQ